MHIEEQKTSKLNLELPEFCCDAPLGSHIPPPLPSSHHFMVFIGPARSGKTSLALSLLTTKGDSRVYRKVWSNVFVFMPPQSRGSLKNDLFAKHDPKKLFDDLTDENISKALEQADAAAAENKSSLILIDDMASSMKDSSVQRSLLEAVANRRHHRISIWILTQAYNTIPLVLRRTITHAALFQLSNKREFQGLFEELLFLPKHEADMVYQAVYQRRHDFMYVDVLEGVKGLYRNFNHLRIKHAG